MQSVDILGQISLNLPAWHLDAACRDADLDLFFVAVGKSIAPALEYCDGCPVRQECLDYAVDNHLTAGIFGGLTYSRRRDYARERGLTPSERPRTLRVQPPRVNIRQEPPAEAEGSFAAR